MTTETKIIKTLIEYDAFHNEDSKVEGIAKLAIDKGFASLTSRQRAVLAPFMTYACDGVEDPGGYHNNCTVSIEGEELISAYHGSSYYGGMLCTDCQSEIEEYRRHWDRISKE